MSSNLVGIEVHGVIAGVELISVILHRVCIGLNYLVEARRPSNGRIGDQLYPGSDGAYHILCPVRCSLNPEVVGPGWHCGYILGVWQCLAGAVVYPGWRSLRYIELGRCADYSANYRHTRSCIILSEWRERGICNPLAEERTTIAVPGEVGVRSARNCVGVEITCGRSYCGA